MKYLLILSLAFCTCLVSQLVAQANPPVVPTTPSANSVMPTTLAAPAVMPANPSAQSKSAEIEVRLSGTSLYEALVKDASSKVDKAIEDREAKRWGYIYTAFFIVAAVFAFFGWQSYAGLKQAVISSLKEDLAKPEFFKAHLEASVIKRVTDDVEKRIQTVSKELAFYRLSILASNLQQGTKFTDVERDAALNSLEELAGEYQITKRSEFEDVLLKIIEAFAAADLNYQIEKIASALPDVIARSKTITQILIQHYGMSVIGGSDVDVADLEKLDRYADACHRLRMQSLAIPYQMVAGHKFQRGEWKNRIEGLFQDAHFMDQKSVAIIVRLLEKNSQPHLVARKVTGQVARFCDAFKAFSVAFRTNIDELKAVANDFEDEDTESLR